MSSIAGPNPTETVELARFSGYSELQLDDAYTVNNPDCPICWDSFEETNESKDTTKRSILAERVITATTTARGTTKRVTKIFDAICGTCFQARLKAFEEAVDLDDPNETLNMKCASCRRMWSHEEMAPYSIYSAILAGNLEAVNEHLSKDFWFPVKQSNPQQVSPLRLAIEIFHIKRRTPERLIFRDITLALYKYICSSL